MEQRSPELGGSLDSVVGGNSTFPLNLSLFAVTGHAADDIDNFVVAGAVGGDEDGGGGPSVCENWPPASEKTPHLEEDWNGGIFQLSCWRTLFLHMAPDVDSWGKSRWSQWVESWVRSC